MAEKGEDGGIGYWIQWQVLVCFLIFFAPGIAAIVLIRKRRKEQIRSADLWVPCWRGINPLWLLVYRTLVSLFMLWLLSRVVVHDGGFAFYFYTQWTFVLVIIYFALAALISAHGCWNYSRQTHDEMEERNNFLEKDTDDKGSTASLVANFVGNDDKISLKHQKHQSCDENDKKAGIWGHALQIIYQTCAGAVMLTDIVFWGLLVPFLTDEHFKVNLLMGCMHTLNIVFLLLDTAVNNMSFPLFRMAYFVLWSCAYVIFQWILHACGFPWWPYPFLELATPWAPLWYLLMAVVHVPCYGFYFLVVKVKNSLLTRFFPNLYIK